MGSRGRRAGYESQGQGERRRKNKLDARAREAVDPRTIQRKQNHRLEEIVGSRPGVVLKGLGGSVLVPCMYRCGWCMPCR